MRSSLIILLSILSFSSKAIEDSSFVLKKIYKGSYESFDVDHLGNVFLVSTAQQLKKINTKGDSVAVFNDVKRFGKLSYIDASNPAKILLYYKGFATAVILDRFLDFKNEINLRKLNMQLVNCISPSFDNNYWIFDEQKYTLKKIDEAGKVLQESNDFRQVFRERIKVHQIIDRNGFVFVNDTTKGILVFDYYGTFKNRIDFQSLKQISVTPTENTVFGFKNEKLETISLATNLTQEMPLPIVPNSKGKYKLIQNRLYILSSEGLYVFGLSQEN